MISPAWAHSTRTSLHASGLAMQYEVSCMHAYRGYTNISFPLWNHLAENKQKLKEYATNDNYYSPCRKAVDFTKLMWHMHLLTLGTCAVDV